MHPAVHFLARGGGEQVTRTEVEANAGPQFMQLRQQMIDLTEQTLARTIDTAKRSRLGDSFASGFIPVGAAVRASGTPSLVPAIAVG
ncbi:MAG: hypothetical protein R6X22_11720 [Gemmatimonadota bacterium]